MCSVYKQKEKYFLISPVLQVRFVPEIQGGNIWLQAHSHKDVALSVALKETLVFFGLIVDLSKQ